MLTRLVLLSSYQAGAPAFPIAEHLGHMVSHLRSSEIYIYLGNPVILGLPPFPAIYWQDHLKGDAYVISSGGTA